ncbi:hypothetical protein HDU93_007922 [Gonapodya sp. JEL0774]|nr:hypothetical protein HDU93_007922 [Gonapodya sp. JEL0774]
MGYVSFVIESICDKHHVVFNNLPNSSLVFKENFIAKATREDGQKVDVVIGTHWDAQEAVRATGGTLRIMKHPLRLSDTPVLWRCAPRPFGYDSGAIRWLGEDEEEDVVEIGPPIVGTPNWVGSLERRKITSEARL